jgi:hypothetical protein
MAEHHLNTGITIDVDDDLPPGEYVLHRHADGKYHLEPLQRFQVVSTIDGRETSSYCDQEQLVETTRRLVLNVGDEVTITRKR